MEYENRDYDDEPQYPRERSRSPRPDRDGDSRLRSASPAAARDDRTAQQIREDEEEAANPGSNLFVTGIHPRLTEEEVRRLFEKYGDVETCSIMRDPHTRESRGFGFVNMVTGEQADAAKSGLQGEVYEGRTLSIEKARRSRPRTPTPGKYFGPPKRTDDRRPPGRFGGGGGDRYNDRRGFGRREEYGGRSGGGRYGGGDRYGDDRYGGGRDYDRYEDRGSYSRRDRDDYGGGSRGYGGGREDRYAGRGGASGGDDDRRGGYGYDRGSARADAPSSYADPAAPAADAAASGGRRAYGEERGADRYERR
ncbi:RNA-binding domain-containing protein [Aureobasidium namibiae CBS 147.97]|uniref:RNA-binding domain-containing protein n=1 Tax=Aureobasidium namibiae CBS 147.97 TaxID=1043004 RepID=A0A074WV88_9PEZI